MMLPRLTTIISLGALLVHNVSSEALDIPSSLVQRPNIQIGPYHTGKPFPVSAARDPNKLCRVKAERCKDSAPAILKAFKDCNHGGTVILDGNYTIASPLDLTFLDSIDVAILGTIKFTDKWEYWVEHSFKYAFQDSSTFWRFGGKDVNIFGHGFGTIDGNGQIWYNMAPYNSTLLRPLLLMIDGLHGGSISGLNLINSPNWFSLYHNSSDLLISDMNLRAFSTNSTVNPRNTDGFDTLRTSNVIIQNSVVHNTDDCVSFKPNSSSIVVQNLRCHGSHGISVGSLGQYLGQVDIVEDLHIYNISMANATDGARLKVWPGIAPGETKTNVGGGGGYVKNVTYDLFQNVNNDWAIQIDQCYGVSNKTLCQEYPSNMTMSDVLIKDMSGTTSTKNDPKVGQLICSSPERCLNFRATNITVLPPSGKPAQWTCSGFDTSGLEGFQCVGI
ncbi:unnamed protein product [Clonostachys rosea f. rosea IK726]|uniref:galacturonan 1,4-alpha-galacturonidase n=2 Tax=Bionectria ochroleuca TaxID=29856 RepID=A0A0B7JMX4_BIOOC|nr:unnamed protein product [Clonostachys rosea f. rosea IK726]